MEKTNKNRKSILVSFLLIVMLTLFCGASVGTVNAYADSPPSIQEVVDETIFIAFKKVEDGANGRTLTACFFVPNGYYLPDIYSYGVFIVPQRYIEKFITRGDYINELEEQGKPYLDIPASKSIEYAKGRGINCGISNIMDANLDLEFVFAMYCKDKDGNHAYTYLERQTYSTSTATAITYEEEEKIAEQRLLDARLEKIARKTDTLSSAVFKYLIIGVSAVVIVWGAYIGIRVVIARKKEEKIDSKNMVKRLLIGIVIMFVLAVALPLLIKGLGAWAI